MPASLSQNIVALRTVLDMTQQDLADQLHVSRALVATWEIGRSTPDRDQLIALAEALGVSAEQLHVPDSVLPDRYGNLQELAHTIIINGERLCKKLREDLWRGAFNPILQTVLRHTNRKQRPYETYDDHWRHELDIIADKQFRQLIEEAILPFFPSGLVLFSEESIKHGRMHPIILPTNKLGTQPGIQDYVIIDPLDRTAEAVRGIAGFASITVGSLAHGPLVSVVFNLFDRHVSCYYAITGKGAYAKFHDGPSQPISPATTTDLESACLAAYVGRPIRLNQLVVAEALFARHGPESPFVNASGCYGFCLVASSQVDAFIEIAKGYAWHDIVSGAHILHEAGGVVRSPDFTSLQGPLDAQNISEISNQAQLDELAARWSRTQTTPAAMPDAQNIDEVSTVATPDAQNIDEVSNQAQLAAGSSRTQTMPAATPPATSLVRRYPFIAAATTDLAAKIAIELAKNQLNARQERSHDHG